MTDGIRNFMYSKHNGGNAKLRIFSFILQLQRIQPNFMNDSIRTFVHTKQLNTLAQPERPKHHINLDFTSNAKFMLLQLRQRKFCSIHIQTLQEIGWFHTFHPSQILQISLTSKNLFLDCWALPYISSMPIWIRYRINIYSNSYLLLIRMN